MNTESRWLQRYQNYQKALDRLGEALQAHQQDPKNWIPQSAVIQSFEFTLELGWKTLKDKLYEDGFEVIAPREVIKTALQNKLILEGEIWLDALEKRNLLSHSYDDETAKEALYLIENKYFEILIALKKTLDGIIRTQS